MISFREKDYMYSYNKMQPKMFSTHLHQYYEFLYFASGSATYIVEGNEYSAESGDLFITRPGELHSIAFLSDDDYERYFIQFSDSFLSDIPVDLLASIKALPFGTGNKIPRHLIEKSNIPQIFKNMGKCVTMHNEETNIVSKAYIIELLYETNHILPLTGKTEATESDRIQTVKAYINENLPNEISLDLICEKAYIDKYYLCHLFKKETGITIKDYINLQRIALAKKLIEEGKNPSSVFRECGFNDYSSFYRVFKKHSGKSPREFFK